MKQGTFCQVNDPQNHKVVLIGLYTFNIHLNLVVSLFVSLSNYIIYFLALQNVCQRRKQEQLPIKKILKLI